MCRDNLSGRNRYGRYCKGKNILFLFCWLSFCNQFRDPCLLFLFSLLYLSKYNLDERNSLKEESGQAGNAGSRLVFMENV